METSNTDTMTTTASLYVGTYAKYNNGDLTGAWLRLEDYSDAEAFLSACAVLHSDEADPEFMFQDYEGFPSSFYSESCGESDLQKLYDALPLIQALEDADDATLVQLHNTACQVLSCNDDEIYDFDDDFFNTFFDGKPMEAARATHFGDVTWNDNYVTFNGYANLQTISNVRSHIDKSMIFEAYESDPREFNL